MLNFEDEQMNMDMQNADKNEDDDVEDYAEILS